MAAPNLQTENTMDDPGSPGVGHSAMLPRSDSMAPGSPARGKGAGSKSPGPSSPGGEAKKKARVAQLNDPVPSYATRTFQAETTVRAMKAMEAELTAYVGTVPFRAIPTYKGVPETPKPSKQTENPDKGATYNRSALARCVLEKLAADIHGSQESHRVQLKYEDFHKVLSAPQADRLELLNPNVELRPSTEDQLVPPSVSEHNHNVFGQVPPAMTQNNAASTNGGSSGILKKPIIPGLPDPNTGLVESPNPAKAGGGNGDEKRKTPVRYVMDTWSRDPMRRGECLVYTSDALKERDRIHGGAGIFY